VVWRLLTLFARTPVRGAETAVWLASSRALADDTGGFYVDRKERTGRFHDEKGEDALLALCEKMCRT
jgi:hypothetical protein